MNTNQMNQTTSTRQKLTFLGIEGHFWSKDGSKLFLVLSGGIAVPVHVNFIKARMGIPYTPVAKRAAASEEANQAPAA